MFKARAFRSTLLTAGRNGVQKTPADNFSEVLMSRVFSAVFTRQDPVPAGVVDESKLKSGLKFSYYQGQIPYLLFGAPTLTPVKSGIAGAIFDISANEGGNGPFGFCYEGYLSIPQDGVYTLHAPEEFMKFRPLAGYDLGVCLGYQPAYANGILKTTNSMQEWYPATRRHAFGNWSVALKKGLHPFRVYYADLRPGARLEYYDFTFPGLNVPGLTKTFFDGKIPKLEISGPGIERQPVPANWLYCK
jgi:hypothetical protein